MSKYLLNKTKISSIFKRGSLLISASIYILSNILTASMSFVLLPILTRYLDTSAYGIAIMFLILTNLLLPFVGMNCNGAIGRQYVEQQTVDIAKYVSNCLIVMAGTTILLCSISFIFADFFSRLVGFQYIWIVAALLFCFGHSIVLIRLTLWQMKKEAVKFGIFQLCYGMANFGIACLFVVWFEWNWQGRVIGQVLISILFAILSLFLLKKDGLYKFNINYCSLRHVLKFGVPLIPHSLAGWTNAMSDRLIIVALLGMSEMGIYAVGYQIGSIINLIDVSVMQAWVPWLYNELNKANQASKKKIVSFTYAYSLLLFGIAFLIGSFSPLIMKYIVGKEFQTSSAIIIWVAFGYAANGMYKMMAGYFFYLEKTPILAVMTVTSAILNVGFTYYFVKTHGLIGAAYATFISYMIVFLLTWFLSYRYYRMPWFSFIRGQ